MSPAQAIDGSADLACWRARAERAEAAAARLRQENSELNARVAALSAEVGRLQEAVTTLSGGCDSVKWLHRDGGKWPHLPTRRGVVTRLSGPGR